MPETVDVQTGEVMDEDVQIQPVSRTALESMERGQVEVQMEFARRYPRSVVQAKREALELATLDRKTAMSMFYSLPRGGKKIEGPSVRLAEIVANAWGHMRVATRDLDVEDKVVRVQALCWDIQKNVAVSVEATRKITRADGSRYNDDMIAMTMSAARSVAFRNAVFKVVPLSHVKDVYDRAKLVALGEGKTMEERRKNVLKEFAEVGGSLQNALDILGRKNEGDITLDDCISLLGLVTAINDKEISLEAVLSEVSGAPTRIGGMSLRGLANAEVIEAENNPSEEKRSGGKKKS